MRKGKIIYLNGVTSTGKTSIVQALRQRENTEFYYLSDDLFEDHIADILYPYSSPRYWQSLSEAVFLMYRTAKLYSDHGKHVVIDSMLLELEAFAPHYERVLELFKENPLHIVQVYCPLELCRQRNLARADRQELQSHEQAAVMAQGVQYSLRVDTEKSTPEQCAAKIAALLL